MNEIYTWWDNKKKYTSSQIRQMQKKIKKSYKKAELLKKKWDFVQEKEKKEAEELLKDL